MLNRLKICRLLTMLGIWAASQPIFAVDFWQLNMYRGVTPISKDAYYLHMVCMAVCAIIGIVVFGVMIYSMIHHRKSKGYKAASFHDNPRLEVVWSIIPFLILVGLAIPATRVLIRMDDTKQSEVTIKVVGYQWRWQYEYLDQGISFFSTLSTPFAQIQNKQKKNEWYLLEVDKPLVVPVNKKIRFLVTSNDVVHSWWVPELGIKRDAIPGFMYEAWATIDKPGTYRGQCAELCGVNHGFMPIVVEAVNQEDFDKWVAAQTKTEDQDAQREAVATTQKTMTRDELLAFGKQRYEQFCSACHQPDGRGIPPMYPALRASSVATGHPISRHIDIILNGIAGSAMQSYKDQLTDEEIAAIATYERNAWDNNTNDVVQAAEVATQRQKANQQPTMVNKVQAGGLQ
ncbi:cytochrome c oxidase subunit II [Legionella anisa]|uniref:Cytochrome c oxidase subunit 2 n=1 Tax=Legionella anisa TaxID=28082 RepID=A0AAX0WXD2_9GAMM|nr:cytochrome c oxidase subunit II [Legionella anisa]AWN72777.1 cytochrome c oxidase subunit II [Legionella anisa]KTC73032.1 cytochrome c oxidase subunit II [Legionella anisa]MBN5937429.1 cytochrome c oxidase subunit II [Legionella anisa]MCW8423572.1 cytochrome c oxidase subunit II [Legionella anisa]MCW8447092.1 cytochrome c oxidase subunit II [Legionella anisa]